MKGVAHLERLRAKGVVKDQFREVRRTQIRRSSEVLDKRLSTSLS